MIFPFDHAPPHVHALARLKLAIADGRVLEARGTVGPAVMRRLQSWTVGHREQLSQLWTSAIGGHPIRKLEE